MGKKIFGGEVSELNDKKDNSEVTPMSIKLLFDNEKFELMKVLCLLNALKVGKKGQRKVKELLFYYSLEAYNLDIYLNNFVKDFNKSHIPSPNQYFRFQEKIKKIILLLSHYNFILVKSDMATKLEDLNLVLTESGEDFFEENRTLYINELYENYLELINQYKFNSQNLNKIKTGAFMSDDTQ